MLKKHHKLTIWLVVVLFFGVALNWWSLFKSELPLFKTQRLEVAAGSSVRKVLMDLQRQGLVRHPLLIEMWLRLLGKGSHWCAGVYQLAPGEDLWGLIQQLTRGEVLCESFTLLPGWNFKELLRHLAEEDGLVHDAASLTAAEIMTRIGHPGEDPEGRFAPDTYKYSYGSSDLELLERAYKLQAVRLKELWSQRSRMAVYHCPYEALIVASILEKESQIPEEQALIAGVIMRRLALKMRLQLDPTVIYALGDKFKGRLRYKDLKIDSRYNTYRYFGLPPTPICQPSLQALTAALQPVMSNYLYYVVGKEGKHQFSASYKEHQVAIERMKQRLV